MQEKSRNEILGQPVLSLTEGLILGRIRQILINGTEKRVQAFIVERYRGGKDDRILPFAAISSFGEDGVIVENQQALERRGMSHQYMRSLRHPLPIIGARVFTASGRTLGKVEEYRFSAENGSLSGLEIRGGLFKGSMLTPGKHIIAISPQTIMMKDEAIDEAIAVEKPLLANMSGGFDAMREKAASLRTNAADATRNLTANLSEAIGLNRSKNEEPQESDTTAAEEIIIAAEQSTQKPENAATAPTEKNDEPEMQQEELTSTLPAEQ